MAQFYVELENENGKIVGLASNETVTMTLTDKNKVVMRLAWGKGGIKTIL